MSKSKGLVLGAKECVPGNLAVPSHESIKRELGTVTGEGGGRQGPSSRGF